MDVILLKTVWKVFVYKLVLCFNNAWLLFVTLITVAIYTKTNLRV